MGGDDPRRGEDRITGSEERYRVISELTSDYAYAVEVDPEDRLLVDWVNEAFIRDFGYSIEEINDLNLLSLIHPDDLDPAIQELKSVLSGEPGVMELRVVGKSGAVRWLNVYSRPIWDEDRRRVVRLYGAAVDVTERKMAEDDLRRSLEELHALRARVEQADSGKRLMLDAVAHELRNPLAAVIGFARTLQRDDLTEDMRAPLVARVVANAEKIDRAIGTLLKVARYEEESPMDRRAVELRALVDRVVSGLDFSSHQLEVDVDDHTVWVDQGKIEIIVDNLVRNALAHTPPGTTITVLMRVGEGLSIIVDDDGPGIPRAEKNLIFQPLWRGSSEAPGSGLGLYLVARLAELHGGQAWVQDRRPRGASFRVWIPQRGAV